MNFRTSIFSGVVLPLLAVGLWGCDGATLSSPMEDTVSERPVALVSDDPVAESSADAVSNEPAVIEAPVPVVGALTAGGFMAAHSAAGAIKVMAVGDSITQGIIGANSYRRDFTDLLVDASCDFKMVGSQKTSLTASGNPDCEDTGAIGDGWGWDGEKSCLVDSVGAQEPYNGSHEGYSAHRADHFLVGHQSSAGNNWGIRSAMEIQTPHVVLLHIGSVDMFNKQTVESTIEDITSVVGAIREVQPETLILIANVIPWYSQKPYVEISQDIRAVGDGVVQLVGAARDPLLKLVDVRTGYDESMMLKDLVHPNETGEAHIAKAFADVYLQHANCSDAYD